MTMSNVNAISFSQLFKNKTTSEDSIFFMQRVAYYTFAQIICLRKVIPTTSYIKKPLDGQPTRLYILKKDKDFVARRAHSKLTGTFDAISKGYLKELMLVISNNQDNSDDALEVFEMRFVYGDQAGVEFADPSGKRMSKLKFRGVEHAEMDFHKFLDDVTTLCQVMEKLPKDSYCSLRSTFYDEITPKDFMHVGWYSSNSLYDFNHPDALDNLTIGQFQAGNSCLLLSVKSVVVHDEVEIRELIKRARSEQSERDDTLDKSILGDESGFFDKNLQLVTSPIITGSINGAAMNGNNEEMEVDQQPEKAVIRNNRPTRGKPKTQVSRGAVTQPSDEALADVGPVKRGRRPQKKSPRQIGAKGKTYRLDKSTPEVTLPASPNHK